MYSYRNMKTGEVCENLKEVLRVIRYDLSKNPKFVFKHPGIITGWRKGNF